MGKKITTQLEISIYVITNASCVEGNYYSNEIIVNVGCKIYAIFDRGPKSIQCKIGTLNEHASKKIEKCDMS